MKALLMAALIGSTLIGGGVQLDDTTKVGSGSFAPKAYGFELNYYIDYDGDGYGNPDPTYIRKESFRNAPEGYVLNSKDCDDTDANVTTECYDDLDGDGYSVVDGDCDDYNSSFYPGATEYCNGGDDDCDGEIDEEDAVDANVWYSDIDGDGCGDGIYTTTSCYVKPTGYVYNNDCYDSAVYDWWDVDGDGYGSYDDGGQDCDDYNSGINPASTEVVNGYDDDCDGDIDEVE